ncbi:intracellular sulfur oxidation DsrE/DsrF family protein [Methylohalomonas lacus]|uniref:Intracellular sulfur oxidation DsrE/DsrF family protein n=1 Tax=Methylohalomonas lacus TaxID=398773 RepID=A0AAE3HJL2_9GAMM|nr:DsrE family protein [Methylohalomonas lacus]MCS3902311.1 intracellular sulfur oxidation DsrE/DsrF family protein [Methylohalomonas lacus]
MSVSRFSDHTGAIICLLLALPGLLGGCDGDASAANQTGAGATATLNAPEPQLLARHDPATAERSPADRRQTQSTAPDDRSNPQFSIAQNQYLFDVSQRSREEFIAFLKRADELVTVAAPETEKLELALILSDHDIDWFAKDNYEQNKELVDLAARLDALEVIDLKICQRAMQEHGYQEDDIPTFIDRVPYAAAEMQRLQGSGYFQL